MSTGDNSLSRAAEDVAGGVTGYSLFGGDEQLELLRDGVGRIDPALVQEARARRRGRPAGARNKRTQKVADYFVRKYGDPLDFYGNVLTTPVADLMAEMEIAQGGDRKHKPVRAIDAMRFQADCAATVLPYIHGKQPVSVEVTNKPDAVIVIPGLISGLSADADVAVRQIEHSGVDAIDPRTLRYEPLDGDDGVLPDDAGDGA